MVKLKWLDGNADFATIFSFDFCKAFDSVSHNILCWKLKQVLPALIHIIYH